MVSYFTKGAMIALALDLTIRRDTGNRSSLDEVMRECWRRFGESGEGMPERGLESVARHVTGLDLREFFERYVRGTTDLPLTRLLGDFGVIVHQRAAEGNDDTGGKPLSADFTPAPWLGMNVATKAGRELVSLVHAGSPAEKAGIAPGDEVVALNDVRWTAGNFASRLREYHAGDRVTVSVFRNDELMHFKARLAEPPEDTVYLEILKDRDEKTEQNLSAWLSA
jgi:predicted metalloprotease with PDZ domain